jgi:U3 small nucleolar RNA-associated protein 12
LNLTPLKYLQRQLRLIKQPDLEPALLTLPFHYVKRMLFLLVQLSRSGLDIELCCRCAVFLIVCHGSQITATTSLLPELLALRDMINSTIGAYRDLVGVNLAGLNFMQRSIEAKEADSLAMKEIALAQQPDTTMTMPFNLATTPGNPVIRSNSIGVSNPADEKSNKKHKVSKPNKRKRESGQ